VKDIVSKTIKNRAFILSFSLLLTIASTTFFSARRIAFYDFNFLANGLHRMSLGQLPYKDFDLVLPPFTFLPAYLFHQLLNIDIYSAIFLSAIITQLFSIVAFHSILQSLFRRKIEQLNNTLLVTLMISAAVINVISIYPNYIYDSVATSLTLGALATLLKYLQLGEYKFLFISFMLSTFSFFTKFNMGGSLILGVVLARILVLGKNRHFKKIFLEVFTLIVLLVSALSSLTFLGIESFIAQTVVAPSEFKGVTKLGQLAQYNYPLLIALLAAILISFQIEFIRKRVVRYVGVLIMLGLGVSLLQSLFFVNSDRLATESIFPSANFIYPVVMLLALHQLLFARSTQTIDLTMLLIVIPIYFFGTFLSQGWSGSSYSLNPLLLILLVTIYLTQEEKEEIKSRVVPLAISALLFVNFLTMGLTGNRLGYVENGGIRSQSFNWTIVGMATSSQDFYALKQAHDFIDRKEYVGTIVEFPAEDSLEQFSSDLIPWSRCLQFTFICPTKSNQSLLEEFITDTPDVVVLKKQTQIGKNIEPIVALIQPILKSCFTDKFSNSVYTIFRADANVQSCIKNIETALDE